MPRGARPSRSAPPCSTASSPASCPTGSTRPCPPSRPIAKGIATRAASGKVLGALADIAPELWGGSADLAESNNTTMEGQPSFIPKSKQTREWSGGPYGRTLHFGIREFGMGLILNGIALEGLTRPYGGTFLVFSDYMRPAVRLAAIQQAPVTFVWTHDSIGLGEDGPTHQPIEHLAALRAIPVVRRGATRRRQRDRRGLAGDPAQPSPGRSGPQPSEPARSSTAPAPTAPARSAASPRAPTSSTTPARRPRT